LARALKQAKNQNFLAHTLSELVNALRAQGRQAEAIPFYCQLAEYGDIGAMNEVGYAYATGKGLDKDPVQAANWFRKAAEQGNSYAQGWLGIMYQRGEGVEKNEAEAAKWYLKAAEKGNARAQFDLARMYTQGLGVEKSESEGAKWFQKATANGNPEALNGLAWLLATSFHEDARNGTNAVAFAEKAVAATSRTNASYLDTLAAAYAETGDFQKAISTQKEAIPLLGAGDDKSIYEAHLKLFEAHTPCRE
jgi:TPR repeat protein